MQGRQQLMRRRIARAAFDPDDALANGRDEFFRIEAFSDAISKTEACKSRVREQDRVVILLVELAQARANVTAQILDDQIGTKRPQLRLASQARRAHASAMWQGIEIGVTVGNKGIARVFAFEEGRQFQSIRLLRGDVLHRMHRDIGAAFEHRLFQFLHEQSLATRL